MLVSYKWLQTYFEESLPPAEELAELLTMRAFEVENVEQKGDDYILDIDVLPNRAHDCLSHRGIARELAVLLKLKIKEQKSKLQIKSKELEEELKIKINEPDLCRRYMGRKIEEVNVGPSPDWLKERLEAIGQKSINNIVDATNYVMFDTGQPLHAFDADKVEGGIVVRVAQAREKITTLDGKEVELDESILVIADDKEPLAIAGVKGGEKAEVDEGTTNIILEAANFAPVSVRKTSRKLHILTDSSKRFENEITPEMAGWGMEEAVVLIAEIAGDGDTQIGDIVDVYPIKANPYKVGVSLDEINSLLGVNISKKEVEDILNRFGFGYERIIPIGKIKEIIDSGIVLGKKYEFGASISYDAPEIFDCSSLTSWIFQEAGIAIPRISIDQFVFSEEIKKDELEFGDLVFSNTGLIIKVGIRKKSVEFLRGTEVPSGVDHVGMYLGNGKILHTSSQTKKAVVEDLEKAAMFKNMRYGRIANRDEERFVVTIPPERLDLRIKEDLIEEIGRVYGYKNITPRALEEGTASTPINKRFYYMNKIRNILAGLGFSEIYTSTFSEVGEVSVQNPIASDKGFLRSRIADMLKSTLAFNIHYADLLGVSQVRIFEIGEVFDKEGEHLSLGMGIQDANKKKNEKEAHIALERSLNALLEHLGVQERGFDGMGGYDGHIFQTLAPKTDGFVFEVNVDKLIEKLSEPDSYEDALKVGKKAATYQKISSYPFVTRDIAVFVPEGIKEKVVRGAIGEKAGSLLVREPRLFDTFEKQFEDGAKKISYAFKIVFQSHEKTLTDEEVNKVMDNITIALHKNEGWNVR